MIAIFVWGNLQQKSKRNVLAPSVWFATRIFWGTEKTTGLDCETGFSVPPAMSFCEFFRVGSLVQIIWVIQLLPPVLCDIDIDICAMVKSRYIGDGHPTFNRNPYNGYINPYYWVDDHPLLYGNNQSLDPGTYIMFKNHAVIPPSCSVWTQSFVGSQRSTKIWMDSARQGWCGSCMESSM